MYGHRIGAKPAFSRATPTQACPPVEIGRPVDGYRQVLVEGIGDKLLQVQCRQYAGGHTSSVTVTVERDYRYAHP